MKNKRTTRIKFSRIGNADGALHGQVAPAAKQTVMMVNPGDLVEFTANGKNITGYAINAATSPDDIVHVRIDLGKKTKYMTTEACTKTVSLGAVDTAKTIDDNGFVGPWSLEEIYESFIAESARAYEEDAVKLGFSSAPTHSAARYILNLFGIEAQKSEEHYDTARAHFAGALAAARSLSAEGNMHKLTLGSAIRAVAHCSHSLKKQTIYTNSMKAENVLGGSDSIVFIRKIASPQGVNLADLMRRPIWYTDERLSSYMDYNMHELTVMVRSLVLLNIYGEIDVLGRSSVSDDELVFRDRLPYNFKSGENQVVTASKVIALEGAKIEKNKEKTRREIEKAEAANREKLKEQLVENKRREAEKAKRTARETLSLQSVGLVYEMIGAKFLLPLALIESKMIDSMTSNASDRAQCRLWTSKNTEAVLNWGRAWAESLPRETLMENTVMLTTPDIEQINPLNPAIATIKSISVATV